MGRKGLKPLIENLLVSDLAAEGKAIAHYNGMVVFISNCVPGDRVDVQIIRKRKRFMEGFPVKFHAYSEFRTKPFCRHFGICGGCKWQHLPYTEQVKFKERQVNDALVRIGKVTAGEMLPALASEKQKGYRNKLEFTFTGSRWLTAEEINSDDRQIERRGLGFHIPGKFDKVLNIEECYLQPEPSNQIRDFVRDYAIQNNLEFFNLITHTGFLRNLIIRNNLAGEFMVILSFYNNNTGMIFPLLDALAEKFPEIVSLMYVINPKANDTLNDLTVQLYKGTDHLVEEIDGLRFRISPKSFFQTNTTQAHRLYSIVRNFAQLSGTETVYDLYTGTGTIALFVAGNSRKVIGIEYVAEAVEDAVSNAFMNNIKNTEFYSGDIRELLSDEFLDKHGCPDVIITDPPRTGMHPDVIDSIIKAAPQRIVYVSCNPATQARDIEILSSHYSLARSQPVDMFPFTHHVENVALLERVNSGS